MSTGSVRRVTVNEVLRLARRVFLALGAGPGCEHEPALAVTWLETRRLGGLEMLDSDLAALRRHGMRTPDVLQEAPGVMVMDARGASAAFSAPSIVDWLRAVGGPAEFGVHAIRSPGWFLPALALGRPCVDVALRARGHDDQALLEAAWQVTGGIRIDAPGGADALAAGDAFVQLRACDAGGAARAGALDAAALDARHAMALAEGVLVDESLWASLGAVARESMVPESDASRTRGAGGGDDNA